MCARRGSWSSREKLTELNPDLRSGRGEEGRGFRELRSDFSFWFIGEGRKEGRKFCRVGTEREMSSLRRRRGLAQREYFRL